MTDPRIAKALDALADVFLSEEVGDVGAAGQAQGRPDPPPANARAGRGAGGPRLDRPIGMTIPRESSGSERRRPRFLRPPHVEGVVLGNLPAVGRPWLAQYAHHLAQQRGGAVAILDLSLMRVRLEVVEPAARSDDLPAVEAATVSELVTGLLGCGAVTVEVLLVHLDRPLSPQLLQQAAAIARWTVCCGADQAALQSAAALIDELAGGGACGRRENGGSEDGCADGEVHGGEEGAGRFGLMLMGCDQTRAHQAAGSFAQQCPALTVPVELRGHRHRMKPLRVQSMGEVSLPEATTPCHELTALLDQLTAGHQAPCGQGVYQGDDGADIDDDPDTCTTGEMRQMDELYRGVIEAAPAVHGGDSRRQGPCPIVRLAPKLP